MARPARKQAPKKAQKAAPKKATVKHAVKPAPKRRPAPAPVAAKPAPGPAPVGAVTARPAAVATRPKPAKSPLSEKELAQIKVELEEQRSTLEREFADLEAGSLKVPQSELSGEASFDEEYADAGTFTFERERDLSLGNNIRDLLDKVGHALRRIAEGSYGICERCGQPIDKARLKALPYSSLCIRCKQLEERAP